MSTNAMNLVTPTTGVTPGPTYADEVNADLAIISDHTHEPGSGQLVPTTGLSATADMTIGNFNLTNVKSTRMQALVAVLSGIGDIRCLYAVNGDLYYNNATGVAVQLTSGGAINASAVGGFVGLAGTTGAATYASGAGSFTFTSSTGVPATVATGPLVVTATDLKKTTITRATGGTNNAVSLPNANPAATNIMQWSAAGVISAVLAVDNSSLQNTGTVLQVKALGVTKAMQAAVGQQASAAASFTGAGTSWANITGFTVTITTSGRPIILLCIAGATLDSKWVITRNAGGTGTAYVQLRTVVSGSATANIGGVRYGGFIAGSGVDLYYPPSIYQHLYAAAAGTYTFQMQYQVTGGAGDAATASDISLVAYEL